jgi:N6-L-threonylcarbamoyladenine synthase
VLTLGIETSCDDTAVAVVANGTDVRASLVSSQHTIHAAYGGIVPELACRSHIANLTPLLHAALDKAGITLLDIDVIAVTQGPGLIGALLVGVSLAKALAYGLQKPLVAVHHLEGHINSVYLEHTTVPEPCIVLVVSGGHSELYYCARQGEYTLLGQTRDDAAGECFDKVAKMLHLGYPGGPIIDRLAQTGNPNAVLFPRAMLTKAGFDFSFSGLKTAVRTHLLQATTSEGTRLFADDTFWPLPTIPTWEQQRNDILASFQHAVTDVLVTKTLRAIEALNARAIAVVGGVACNSALRHAMSCAAAQRNIPVFFPSPHLCTDNAAMIAYVGTYRYEQNPQKYQQQNFLDLDAYANLSLANHLS